MPRVEVLVINYLYDNFIQGSTTVMSNLPIMLFGIVSMVAAGVGFTLPETKSTVMPDNIDDIENDCDSATCGHTPPPKLISDFKKSACDIINRDREQEQGSSD